ncbi:MAG: aspartate kinase [Candidatus Lokiarchaeota archaeon]|nr:aspartate kinase [Candidatus Lokiarchaeota archaeon]
MTIIVMKFGGSCLKDAKSFENSINAINKFRDDSRLIIVCSALKGVTNYLMETSKGIEEKIFEPKERIEYLEKKHKKLAKQVIKDDKCLESCNEFINKTLKRLQNTLYGVYEIGTTTRSLDFILSFGERLSTYIVYEYLRCHGFNARFKSADEFIYTNMEYKNQLPLFEKSKKAILSEFKEIIDNDVIGVVTGYISRNIRGNVTTLGRGGSDLTATLMAYSLNDLDNDVRVILWKDVPGLLTASPKIEEDARLIDKISYNEAREMAYFGSKILHPLCIIPAQKLGIPIEIRNYNKQDARIFTTIGEFDDQYEEHKKYPVKAITSSHSAMITVSGEAMVSLPGTAARIFSIMGDNNVNVIMISQSSSENNITFLVEDKEDEIRRAREALENSEFFGKNYFDVKIDDNVCLIAVVGPMAYIPGVAGKLFSLMGDNNINIRAIAQGSSELNISFVIKRDQFEKAIRIIHKGFGLEKGEKREP